MTPGDVVPAVDLSSGRSFVNGFPHEFFAWLRREQPVWWHDATDHTPGGEGFWVVSRHADALAIMRDPGTFSSALGGTAINDSTAAGLSLNQTDAPSTGACAPSSTAASRLGRSVGWRMTSASALARSWPPCRWTSPSTS